MLAAQSDVDLFDNTAHSTMFLKNPEHRCKDVYAGAEQERRDLRKVVKADEGKKENGSM